MLDNINKEKKGLTLIENGKGGEWNILPSTTAINCRNPIREIVDDLNLEPNPSKPVIALSIGDPTVYGNLKPSKETVEAVINALREGKYNGYVPCVGRDEAREAVAEYLSHDGVEFKAKDIILCSGCSSAIEHCITALCDPVRKHNILLPRPGFCLYKTHAEAAGIQIKYYNLIPEQNWEVDLTHLESQIDQNTAAIVLVNPSNPCGSVFTESHLRSILEIAYQHHVPIISDEIYEQMVFSSSGKKFVSTAALHSGVPILICGGIAKRFLVPGWRLGWIAIHDEVGAFTPHIRKALGALTQRIIGCNTLIQGALPAILQNTPQKFHDDLNKYLGNQADLVYNLLLEIKGLTPIKPEGAMYIMVEIQLTKFPFKNGLEFVVKLMEEESVFGLPGEPFEMPGFMRIVLSVPEDLLREACLRISEFCNRHYCE